jgi:S-adenosylmethionine:diacylglycerol 3-amino-3-carboxypropyl transferase
MYEDPSIETAAFARGSRVFCIASAGCTAMRLAAEHEVVAVDINPVQVEYARRRFDGEPAHRGRAERVMDVARFFGPLAGWWPSKVREFVELSDPEAQMSYFKDRLDTWRFRRAFDLLFSFRALRVFYSSTLLDQLPDHLGRVMRGRMERCFARHPNGTNPYARALLLGELSSAPPPPEAKDILLAHADAADFLENQPASSFDGFTLSNILDGTDEAYRRRLFDAVMHAATPDAVVVVRSFNNASVDAPLNRAADDRAMLWGTVLAGPPAEAFSALLPTT